MNIPWPHVLKRASIILCFIVVSAVVFLMNTTIGLKLLVRYAQPALLENGITVDPDKIQGRLSSFTIDELVYHEEIKVRLKQLHVSWEPWSIWFRQISVPELSADELEVVLGNQEKLNTRAAFKAMQANLKFKMPTIRLHQLNIKTFRLNDYDGSTIVHSTQVAGDATVTNEDIYFNHLQSLWQGFSTKLFGRMALSDARTIDLKGQLSQDYRVGQVNLNIVLLLASHVLKIKGDGSVKMGASTIPIAYELVEKENHFNLVATDTENPQDPQLALNLKIFKSPSTTFEASFNAKALNINHLIERWKEPINLSLNVSGDRQQFSIHSEANSEYKTQASVVLNCQRLPDQKNCQLQTLNLHYEDQTWALAESEPLHITPDFYELKHLCLKNTRSQVCMEGHYHSNNSFAFSVNSEQFDNAALNPLIYPLKTQGFSQFHLAFNQTTAGFNALLKAESNNSIFRLDDDEVAFTSFKLQGSHAQHVSKFSLQFLTEKNDTGRAELELSQQDQSSPRLRGTVDLDLKNLNPINLYLSNLYEIDGAIQAKINLSGTLDDPIYDGSLMVANSNARIPQLGLTLQDIDLDIFGKRNSQIQIKGSAKSGSGPVTLKGMITLSQRELVSLFELHGDQIQLVNLPNAQAVGALDLQFKHTGYQAKLSGTIHIYQGKFNGHMLQRRFGSDTDVIFVDDEGEPLPRANPLLQTTYDLHLIVDNAVSFSGFDASTRVGGELFIHAVPQNLALANGQLELINGTYDAYDKHFIIEKGLLIYSQSALDNPNLDVTATYDLQNSNFNEDGFNKLEIRIRALGSLRQPQLVLSSRPALSQEDILSYLVVGAPLNQAGDNSAPLSKAALGFALKGGSQNVLNNIRKSFGLSQLNLGSITPSNGHSSNNSGSEDRGFQDNTAVFVGKSISPNLYVSYGVGLFNAQKTFRTRLKLGRHWQLITETSNVGDGADFVYVIERGEN